jgi:hypothetical protein
MLAKKDIFMTQVQKVNGDNVSFVSISLYVQTMLVYLNFSNHQEMQFVYKRCTVKAA